MQFNKNQNSKKKTKKKPNILGMVKKMMNKFIIKGNKMSMQ